MKENSSRPRPALQLSGDTDVIYTPDDSSSRFPVHLQTSSYLERILKAWVDVSLSKSHHPSNQADPWHKTTIHKYTNSLKRSHDIQDSGSEGSRTPNVQDSVFIIGLLEAGNKKKWHLLDLYAAKQLFNQA